MLTLLLQLRVHSNNYSSFKKVKSICYIKYNIGKKLISSHPSIGNNNLYFIHKTYKI